MRRKVQIILSLAFIGIMVFCVYGFYASFEQGLFSTSHLFYGIVGVVTLAAAARIMLGHHPAFKEGRLVELTLIAGLLFLVLVLLLWLRATGGQHMPWPR